MEEYRTSGTYNANYVTIIRELVEQGAEELLCGGAAGDVALLVVGDPFGATTHTDLVLRKASKYRCESWYLKVKIYGCRYRYLRSS